MARYAQIAGGVVVAFLPGPPEQWADLHAADALRVCGPEVQNGWTWNGSGFEPPAAPQGSRILPPLEFRRRFTPAERSAITIAAAQWAQQGFPILQEFMDDLSAAGQVDLDSPDLREGMDLLLYFDLLTPERPAKLLA
jgi:hypothetical protein